MVGTRPVKTKLSKDKKLELLRTMVTIRAFEEKVKELYLAGKIRGTVHLSTGMEAVAAGACLSLNPDDYMNSTHRGHGHCIAKGVGLNGLMAEIMGRATGVCHGRGGTMHVFDVAHGVMGTIGIVGGGIPIATGLGLGIQQLKLDRVALCFLGDGATNQGAFHEAVNLGAVWKLPVVYLIENNLVGDTTPLREVVLIKDLADRAVSYGIPGVIADGNDVLDVHAKVSAAVSRARNGEGPSLVECKTYRWEGHQVGDPCVYRTKEDVEAWRKKCPIARFKSLLVKERTVTEKQYQALVAERQAAVEAAAAFALNSPEPDPATVCDHVY